MQRNSNTSVNADRWIEDAIQTVESHRTLYKNKKKLYWQPLQWIQFWCAVSKGEKLSKFWTRQSSLVVRRWRRKTIGVYLGPGAHRLWIPLGCPPRTSARDYGNAWTKTSACRCTCSNQIRLFLKQNAN